MHKAKFLFILPIIILLLSNGNYSQNKANDESFYLFGSLESNRMMTGFFSRNHNHLDNKNWLVFIGKNSKVYKISLINKNISTLYIDGEKIADSEIWKHTAEYKPFLEKFWRNEELEIKSENIDTKIELIDQKTETIDKEIQKLDQTEEKLDKLADKGSDVSFDRKSLNSQRRRLAEIQDEYAKELEVLSNQQEKISNEQDSLNLIREIDKILRQINEDLKSLDVVKSVNNNSFKLSSIELIVNNKKVSNDIYEQLKAKYIAEFNGESGYLYRWKEKV
jgi:DNA repair exonuclease SbcCD ATPase subunit